jgi:myo-inositol-1(or 4)-monophosphatase
MTPNPAANAPDNVQALLDSDERLQLAWDCGREAANFLHTARPANLVIETKSTSSDLVSAMDKGAEEIIVSAIRSHFPEDGILGEEGTSLDSSNGVRWIIDPLDGTVNYLFGIPLWGVSIAVEFEGLVKLGVIVLPTQGEVYVASHNQGSWKVSYENTALSISGEQPALVPTGQTRLRVRPTTAFARALISTGFGYDAGRREAQAQLLVGVLPKFADIRRSGCAVVDFCWLASGVTDGYYEYGLNAWDYAAGALLVSEAGGIVQGLVDADFSQFLVASTPMIFDELRAVLREGGAQKVLDC